VKWVATVVLQWLVWGKTFDRRVWLSLLPVVGGIVLTSFTELSFNLAGFLAAFLGCMVQRPSWLSHYFMVIILTGIFMSSQLLISAQSAIILCF
jgi:hypothetical protein